MPHVSASSAFLFCTHKTENQASHFPNVPESSLEKSSWRRMPTPLALAQRGAGRRNMPLILFSRRHRHRSAAHSKARYGATGLSGRNGLRLRKLKLRRNRFKGKDEDRNAEFIRKHHTARTGIPFCIAFLSTPMYSSNLCLAQHPSQHSRSNTLALFFVGPPAKNKPLDFYLAQI